MLKLKARTLYDPAIPLLGTCPTEGTHMAIERNVQEGSQSQTGNQTGFDTSTDNYGTLTLEHHAALRINKLQAKATTGMNCTDTGLSKGNQTQKTTYYIMQFLWSSKTGKTGLFLKKSR